MKIELYPNAIPFSVPGHCPIPFAQREQVREMLEDMVSHHIIAHVTGPTDWTHPLVVAAKPNGKLRMCVDLTKLNQFVQHLLHPIVPPRDAIASITCHARYFNKLDAAHGYWQIPLDEKSQLLTTFITPWGRFKFLRGPMGLVSTGDEYCKRMGAAIDHRPRQVRVVDDILTNTSIQRAYEGARDLLTICRANHIMLNAGKFQFATTETRLRWLPTAGRRRRGRSRQSQRDFAVH